MHVTDTATSGTRKLDAGGVTNECRDWLAAIGDELIPPSDSMPAASDADVGKRQLDVVLNARPDLFEDLIRAWSATAELSAREALSQMRSTDSALYESICLIVAGGYYTNRDVIKRLGYTGQTPRTIQIGADIDEDLLARVIERGPKYRPA